jgi:transcriptional regulator with XRE-family HTH domain
MTQKEVAEKIGVGQPTYTNYESGIREPNGDTIVKLANLFDTTTDYLLGRAERQEPYYHEKLEDSLKQTYLSLPREVRAKILQAMVDAVLGYQQRECTDTESQRCIERTTTLGALMDESNDKNSEKGAG